MAAHKHVVLFQPKCLVQKDVLLSLISTIFKTTRVRSLSLIFVACTCCVCCKRVYVIRTNNIHPIFNGKELSIDMSEILSLSILIEKRKKKLPRKGSISIVVVLNELRPVTRKSRRIAIFFLVSAVDM